jgi:hypothetical protein
MIRRLGRELQLVIDLIQQIFRLLTVALQILFIGLLGGNDLLKSVPA